MMVRNEKTKNIAIENDPEGKGVERQRCGMEEREGEAAGERRKDSERCWQLKRQTRLLYSLRQLLPSCHTLRFSHPRQGWDIQHTPIQLLPNEWLQAYVEDYCAEFMYSREAYWKEFCLKQCATYLDYIFSFCGLISLSAFEIRSGQDLSFSVLH